MKKFITVLVLSFLLGNLVARVSYEPDFCPVKDKKPPGEYLSKITTNDVDFTLVSSNEANFKYRTNYSVFDVQENYSSGIAKIGALPKFYFCNRINTSNYAKEKLHLLNCCIKQCRQDSSTFSTYINSTPLYLLNCTIKQC